MVVAVEGGFGSFSGGLDSGVLLLVVDRDAEELTHTGTGRDEVLK